MKLLLTFVVSLFLTALVAQPKQNQFVIIVRSKAQVSALQKAIHANIKHWQTFMQELGRSGKMMAGYRPANDGVTMSGAHKTAKKSIYVANGEVFSTVLIIKASDMNEAKQIAANCPVFEMGGSVEIRPVTDTAN